MTLSSSQITELNKNNPAGVNLFLLEITKITRLDGTRSLVGRFINNSEDVIISGDTYTAVPFKISLPPSNAKDRNLRDFTFPLYDPSFVNVIRSIMVGSISKYSLEFKLGMVSSLDYTKNIGGFFKLLSQGVRFNKESMTFSLGFERLSDVGFPFFTFTRGDYPALY